MDKYCQHLGSHYLANDSHRYDILKDIAFLACRLNLSLRDIERIFTNLALYKASKFTAQIHPFIISLAVLKVANPQLFDQIKNNKASYQDVIEGLGLSTISEDDYADSKASNITRWLQCVLLTNEEYQKLPRDEINQIENLHHPNYYKNRHGMRRRYVKKMSSFHEI